MNKKIEYRIDKKDNYYKLIKLTIYDNCRFKEKIGVTVNDINKIINYLKINNIEEWRLKNVN